MSDGVFIQVEPGNRAQGTRSPVHTHPNSGATCVIQGEMTLILEGVPDQTFRGALLTGGNVSCYRMPAPEIGGYGNKMTALNTGNEPALIIDIFPVPKKYNDNPMAFPPMCVLQTDNPSCYITGSGCQ